MGGGEAPISALVPTDDPEIATQEQFQRLVAENAMFRKQLTAASAAAEETKVALREQTASLKSDFERQLIEQTVAAQAQYSSLNAELRRVEQQRQEDRNNLTRQRDTLAVELEHARAEAAQLRSDMQRLQTERDEATTRAAVRFVLSFIASHLNAQMQFLCAAHLILAFIFPCAHVQHRRQRVHCLHSNPKWKRSHWSTHD